MIRITAHRDPAWIPQPVGLHTRERTASPGPIPQDGDDELFHYPEPRTKPSRSSWKGSYRLNPAGGGVIISAALLKYVAFSHDLSAPVSHYIQLILFPQTRCGRMENTAWIHTVLDSGGKPNQILLGRRVYNDPNCASVSSKNCQFNHSNLHRCLKIEEFSNIPSSSLI